MNRISRQTDRDRSFVGAFAKRKLSLKNKHFAKTKKNQTFCKKKIRTFCKHKKNLRFAMELIMFSSSISSKVNIFFSKKTKEVPSNSRKWGIFQHNAKRLYWNRAKPYIIRKSKHDCLSVSSPCSLFINTPMK